MTENPQIRWRENKAGILKLVPGLALLTGNIVRKHGIDRCRICFGGVRVVEHLYRKTGVTANAARRGRP